MSRHKISHRTLLSSVLPLRALSPELQRLVSEALLTDSATAHERAARDVVRALTESGVLRRIRSDESNNGRLEQYVNRDSGDTIHVHWTRVGPETLMKLHIPAVEAPGRISLPQARRIIGLDSQLFTPEGHHLSSYTDIIRIALGIATDLTGADYCAFVPTQTPADSLVHLENEAEAPIHAEALGRHITPGEQVVAYVKDLNDAPEFAALAPGDDYRSVALVTVGHDDPPSGLQGILQAWSRHTNALSEEQLLTLGLFAQQLGATFRKAELLERLVFYDSLTGLYNRHFFNVQITKEIERARREARSFGLAIIDLDDFKHVNTRFGYYGGNDLLVQVSELLRNSIRPFDAVARWGGEEFALILTGPVGPGDVTTVCNRLREAAAAHPYTVSGMDLSTHDVTLTLSIGVALYPTDGNSVKALWASANSALQAAKDGGKNRVVSFSEIERGGRRRRGA